MVEYDSKKRLIQDGITFIHSITEVYGHDEGFKVWNKIAEAIDPKIKGEILFDLIRQEFNATIVIHPQPVSNRVELIKTIRNGDIRHMGLKEAKDLSDQLSEGRPIRITVEAGKRFETIERLRQIGIKV